MVATPNMVTIMSFVFFSFYESQANILVYVSTFNPSFFVPQFMRKNTCLEIVLYTMNIGTKIVREN